MPKPAAKKTVSVLRAVGNNWRIILPLLVALVIVLSIILSRSAEVQQTPCGPYTYDRTVTVGKNHLGAEIASSDSERAKGLSGRRCIPNDLAMLFIFKQPGYYSFWMKDMKFPIDIIWISPDHKAVDILRNIKPSSYPYSFANKGQKAQYVLEIAANRSKSLGLNPGTTVSF